MVDALCIKRAVWKRVLSHPWTYLNIIPVNAKAVHQVQVAPNVKTTFKKLNVPLQCFARRLRGCRNDFKTKRVCSWFEYVFVRPRRERCIFGVRRFRPRFIPHCQLGNGSVDNLHCRIDNFDQMRGVAQRRSIVLIVYIGWQRALPHEASPVGSLRKRPTRNRVLTFELDVGPIQHEHEIQLVAIDKVQLVV